MSTDAGHCCYRLQFANDQGVLIVGSCGARRWVNKLSSIMRMKPAAAESCGLPKVIFTQRPSHKAGFEDPAFGLDNGIKLHLPMSGWQVRYLSLIRVWSHDNTPDLIVELEGQQTHKLEIIRMWLARFPIYEQVQETGGLPFHAALIEWNRLGVLLAASGGTGKSTCCLRLPPPWHVLCDDETLIVRDHQARYLAHPFPTWSDYLFRRSKRTWNVQRHVPLYAIFFLEQAEADDIIPIGQGQATVLISQSTTEVCCRSWENLDRRVIRALRKKLFDNACQLARTIPAFILHVSRFGTFWDEIEMVLINL